MKETSNEKELKELILSETEEEVRIKEADEYEANLQEFTDRFVGAGVGNPWGFSAKGEVAKSAVMSMLSTKCGLYARIPITCKAEGCPYAESCTLLECDLAPFGEKCAFEVALIEQALAGYYHDFELNDNASFTDLTIVKSLVNCDIMMERAQALLSNEGMAIDQTYAGSNEKTGEDFYNKEISKALELYERHEKQKRNLLDIMLGTRKAKAQAKLQSTSSLSDILSEAMSIDIVDEQRPDEFK